MIVGKLVQTETLTQKRTFFPEVEIRFLTSLGVKIVVFWTSKDVLELFRTFLGIFLNFKGLLLSVLFARKVDKWPKVAKKIQI